jgi:glycosyltransferase involved in cell wall biosynthesis
MLVVWLLRPNLQKKFPLHKNRQRDYLGFLGWCTMIGRRECRLLTEIEAWNQELQQPINLPKLHKDPWDGTYTVGMYLVGLHRAKYWDAQIQVNTKLRHRTARWYFREGRQILDLKLMLEWQLEALMKNHHDFTRFEDSLRLPNDDKQTKIALSQNLDDIARAWGSSKVNTIDCAVNMQKPTVFKRILAARLPVYTNQVLSLLKPLSSSPDTSELTTVAKKANDKLHKSCIRKETKKPFGVNLYGYAKGELGIGEDVRMLALALEAADVPFCVINIELGKDVSQKDNSADQWLVTEPLYAINIFCMTGIEMCRYACEKGTNFTNEYYNIGLWPWELPKWPEAWHHAWSLVDEIWGISHYTANAYASAPVPVTPIPLPVVVGDIAPLNRSHWQLPTEAYLFVFSFDMNSRLSRKNPQAVIRAFKKAAEGKNENETGLVLKISHLRHEKPEWKTLEKLIGDDPRIHLITAELRRPEVLALYENCSCYISLHRSEGFGRGLAEAQLLGLPLITTGYSGNMDFCHPPTQCVDYKLIKLEKGDYFYGEGQQWAEPDINHAAQLMKECFTQDRNLKPVKYDTEQFSPGYAGEKFTERLQEIFQSDYESGRMPT